MCSVCWCKFLSGREPCKEFKVIKFQAGTIFTRHTTDGQIHSIGKAIRPLFADPVTYNDCNLCKANFKICAISSFLLGTAKQKLLLASYIFLSQRYGKTLLKKTKLHADAVMLSEVFFSICTKQNIGTVICCLCNSVIETYV